MTRHRLEEFLVDRLSHFEFEYDFGIGLACRVLNLLREILDAAFGDHRSTLVSANKI